MRSLTRLAHDELRRHIPLGSVVIDATAGNGYDTAFLVEVVGPEGFVYAIDIQRQSVAAIERLIQTQGSTQVHVLQADHANLEQLVRPEHQGRIAAVMFNLGYLPGADHSVTTKPATTRSAILEASQLLQAGGQLSVIAYRGHAGGVDEADAVAETMELLRTSGFAVSSVAGDDAVTTSPILWLAAK